LAAERGGPSAGAGAAGSHSALSVSAGNVNERWSRRLVGATKAPGIDISATLLGRTDNSSERFGTLACAAA